MRATASFGRRGCAFLRAGFHNFTLCTILPQQLAINSPPAKVRVTASAMQGKYRGEPMIESNRSHHKWPTPPLVADLGPLGLHQRQQPDHQLRSFPPQVQGARPGRSQPGFTDDTDQNALRKKLISSSGATHIGLGQPPGRLAPSVASKRAPCPSGAGPWMIYGNISARGATSQRSRIPRNPVY